MRASAEQEVCPCSAQPHAADPCNAQGAIRSRCSNSEQARLQKKRKGGYTQQPPASPAAARRTKQQKIATIKQSITRKTVKTGKGGIKEKIWCLDCRVQIESKPSNSLVQAHIRQHEARGERKLYARATPAGLYRVGPEFWTNNGQML